MMSASLDRDSHNECWLQEVKKEVDEGTIKLEFIPVDLYEWCVEKGKINLSDEEKKDIWKEAIEKRQARIEPGTPAIARFLRMKELNKFDQEERAVLKGYSKKIALYNYLWNLE